MKLIFPYRILPCAVVKFSSIFLIALLFAACSEESAIPYKMGQYKVEDIQVYAQNQPVIGNLEQLQKIRDELMIEAVQVSEKEIVVIESNKKSTFVVTPDMWAINEKYTFQIEPLNSHTIKLKSINYPHCKSLNCIVTIIIARND